MAEKKSPPKKKASKKAPSRQASSSEEKTGRKRGTAKAEGYPAVSLPEPAAPPPPVELRRELFIENLLRHPELSVAEAARLSGYSETWARKEAYRFRRDPAVQARINERLNEARVETDEILGTLNNYMRASIADVTDETGRLDMAKAQRNGAVHLIKEIIPTRWGIKVKMYDAYAAATDLAKIKGLYQEPQKNQLDFERERKRYEKMIEQYIKRCLDEEGKAIERPQAIEALSVFDEEIRRYCE